MVHFSSRLVCALVVTIASLSPAMAEKMNGKDVVSLLSRGTIEFQAGSVWETLPGNRYSMTHPTAKEAGTFQIFSNGTIERVDETTGRTIRYHFDRAADGTISAGYGNGSSYAIK